MSMTIKRAIKILDNAKHLFHFSCAEIDQNIAMDMAIAALKKQEPAAPLPENDYGNGKCPSCGAVFLDKSTNFCGNCGQALKWGDRE